jgi:hypothetical protein
MDHPRNVLLFSKIVIECIINRTTGSTRTTVQPPYILRVMGGDFKCLHCPDESISSSDQELKKHKEDDVHGIDIQGSI